MAGDFTSALYLGFRHGHGSLKPWDALTQGKPAALGTPVEHATTAQAVARLMGCERGVFATSTLHLYWDLFLLLANRNMMICFDEGSYAVVKWGVERAACRGIRVAAFRHYDPESLARVLRDNAKGMCPLVVADGVCPVCGVTVPLGPILDIVRRHGGLLVLDDTQGIGLMGESPDRLHPYGRGGGGTLRRHGVTGNDILVASSLAKGFGVPVAVLAGADEMVRLLAKRSETRMHCSPPSSAVVAAAGHALTLNSIHGDTLRRRLAALVERFRSGIAETGLSTTGKLFPVQTIIPFRGLDVPALHARLLGSGIQTVLQKSRRSGEPLLSFIITADKRITDIDNALEALDKAVYSKRYDSLYDKGVDHDPSIQRTAP